MQFHTICACTSVKWQITVW